MSRVRCRPPSGRDGGGTGWCPLLLVVAAVMAAVLVVPLPSALAAGPNPIPVTPFAGFNATLMRAPYVTDLTQTSARRELGHLGRPT